VPLLRALPDITAGTGLLDKWETDVISLSGEVYNIMCLSMLISQESSCECLAKKLRISNLMTQKELATIAGVSPEELDLLEQNLPVRLDTRRKILGTLWAIKSRKENCQLS